MKARHLAPLLLALSAAALPVGSAWADPPPWAPAHGYRAKHSYIYYPVHEIYYEPAQDLWFWLDGGDWRFGLNLPVYYQQYTRGGITIDMDADRPYTYHTHVVQRYGGGGRVVNRYYTAPVVIEEHHYHGKDKHKHKHDKHDD